MTKSAITREQLIKKAQEQIEFCRHTKITGEGRVHVNQCAALFEIALAAIDSEPVAEVLSNRPGNDTSTIDRALPVGTQLYRHAQPAPEKATVGEMPFLGTSEGAYVRGWNDCRAAMLQHQPQNAQQNIPENIPGGLVEAVNNLLNNDGSRGCYDAMECGTAREKIELWLAQRQRWEEQRKANLSAGNSPVIPDGYVMVPKEPTQAMCAAFNDSDYGRKSLRERYVAMLAAADCSIPMISDRWVPVSERMPERGDYLVTDGRDFDVQSFDGEQFIPGFVWEDAITHWMPLPAAPQEVGDA